MKTLMNKTQVRDPEFALQHELDSAVDNSTGLFVPSTMNNKALYDLLQLIKDNNTGTFVPSTMNNKSLYDLITSRIYGTHFQYLQDLTFVQTTSTVFITRSTMNTITLAANAKYKIEYSFNYTGAAANTATYTDVKFLIDSTINVPVMYETNTKYDVASIGHLISGHFRLTTTIATQHQIALQFRSTNGVGVRLGNIYITLFREE